MTQSNRCDKSTGGFSVLSVGFYAGVSSTLTLHSVSFHIICVLKASNIYVYIFFLFLFYYLYIYIFVT